MKKLTMKRTLFVLLALFLTFGLAACGQDIQNEPASSDIGAGSESTNNDELQEQPDDSSEEEAETTREQNIEQKLPLTIYYTNPEVLGLEQETHELSFTSDDELWQRIWSSLQQPKLDDHITLWKGVELLEPTLQDGKLTLDIHKPDGNHWGSSGEAYAIQAVIQTYGQVEGVESVQFMVEGEVVESLYGHVSIDEPFSKDHQLIEQESE